MAIHIMIRPEDAGKYAKSYVQWQSAGSQSPNTGRWGQWMAEVYRGQVVGLRERNGYDDSDFFAIVFDGEEAREIMYATTRGWTYPAGASIDASDELMEKYREYKREKARQWQEHIRAEKAKIPYEGKTVQFKRSATKRQKYQYKKGDTGKVFWFGQDRYQRVYHGTKNQITGVEFPWYYRIGVLLANGTRVFAAATTVEVIDNTQQEQAYDN